MGWLNKTESIFIAGSGSIMSPGGVLNGLVSLALLLLCDYGYACDLSVL